MSSRTAIKANFETGDIPTEAQFGDLIDSLAHTTEDGFITRFITATDATTARTLGLTDNGAYLRFTNAGAVTVTVPLQATVAWLANTEIIIFQAGAGAVTIAAAGGVTINTPETLVAAKQYATLTLKRVAADVWDLSGNLGTI